MFDQQRATSTATGDAAGRGEPGTLPAVTRLLLLRHAQSEWNEQGRWQGRADPPLSEHGRNQARLAAGGIDELTAVAASSLGRASQTARIIAEEIGVDGVHVDDDLMERDVGPWSGLTRAEIEERYPGYLDDRRRPEGWEPDEALLERALAAIDRLLDAFAGETVMVVTHGGLIYAVERHLGAEWERMPNLGGRWVHAGDDGLVLGRRLLLVDDDAPTPRGEGG